MTFDRFHLAAKLSEAVDAVRRHEVATRPELARLMRPSAHLATARALRWREDFQAFYDQDPRYAPDYLQHWCSGAKRSRPQPIKDFLALVEKHWEGILAWHKNHLTNGLLEGINSLIQAAKARARGYRSKAKIITIVYLIASKTQDTHPHPSDTRLHDLTLSNPLKTAKSPNPNEHRTVS